MRACKILRSTLCYLLVAVTILTPEFAVAQETGARGKAREVALQMIPDDSAVALICFPANAMRAPATQMLPVEVASAAGLKYLGIDPADVDILVAAGRFPERAMPTGALVIRTTKPIDTDAIPMELTGRRRVDELNGKTYWKTDKGMNWLFLNDKTVVIGLQSMIKAMASRKGTLDTPLKKHLAAGNPQSVNLVVALAPFRPMLNQQLEQAPLFPDGLEQLKSIPEDTEAIELRINASQSLSGQLAIHGKDASAAQRIENTIDSALNAGRKMMLEKLDDIAPDDPVMQASAKYAKRMSDSTMNMLRPERTGNKLTLGATAGQESQVVVISTLIALLLPAVQAAREAARRAQSVNHSRNIMLGLLKYETVHGEFPAHAMYVDGKPALSWRVAILPLLDQKELYDKFHLDEPWNSPHNKKLIPLMPTVFQHPSSSAKEGYTHYKGLKGEKCFFTGDNRTRKLRRFTAISGKIAFLAADEASIWTKPEDLIYDSRNPLRGLGSLYSSRKLFAVTYCDGAIRMIGKDIDPDEFRAAAVLNVSERDLPVPPGYGR